MCPNSRSKRTIRTTRLRPPLGQYSTLAKASFHTASNTKTLLNELAGVLCEVKIGTPIKNGKKAAQIRRYTLNELMNSELKRKLID